MSEVVTNTIGMELVSLPAGSYIMGGDALAEQADEHERPRHRVTFPSPFSMGKYPVTQAQWEGLMASNPSHFKDAARPVEMVSHTDALGFVQRLNQKESTQAYHLPTEAQWEYAARAGSESAYCFGAKRMKLGQYAWYRKNSEAGTHPVGQLLPNRWNLHDMHGNVHEWCWDWFDRNYYGRSPEVDPRGPARGLGRSLRGGDWGSADWFCRCASRSLSSPDRRSPRVGFRVVKL